MALLNVGTVIGAWLVVSTVGSLYLKSQATNDHADAGSAVRMSEILLGNPVAVALLFFNYLNIFIAWCEIALGRHIQLIKKEYVVLKEHFKGKEWDGCLAFLTMPLTMGQIFNMKTWSKMWTTYALCKYMCHANFMIGVPIFSDLFLSYNTLTHLLELNVLSKLPPSNCKIKQNKHRIASHHEY